MGARPLRIRFYKIDGFIKNYDGTKYLILFGLERYDAIYDWIKYIISEQMVLNILLVITLQKTKADLSDYLITFP